MHKVVLPTFPFKPIVVLNLQELLLLNRVIGELSQVFLLNCPFFQSLIVQLKILLVPVPQNLGDDLLGFLAVLVQIEQAGKVIKFVLDLGPRGQGVILLVKNSVRFLIKSLLKNGDKEPSRIHILGENPDTSGQIQRIHNLICVGVSIMPRVGLVKQGFLHRSFSAVWKGVVISEPFGFDFFFGAEIDGPRGKTGAGEEVGVEIGGYVDQVDLLGVALENGADDCFVFKGVEGTC